MAENKVCAVDDCGKPAYVRGWCTTHYQRWQKWGDPLKGGWHRKIVCDVDGCVKKVFAKGRCQKHYEESRVVDPCSVDGCDRLSHARGLCKMHYKRFLRHGDAAHTERLGNGEYRRWIEDHVRFDGSECLIWPYWRDKQGYGPIREMCSLAHGEPPTKEHQAAHSCGKGHEGCMHPGHLRWATRHENQQDMVKHGNSLRGQRNWNVKLTERDVAEIRSSGAEQKDLALRYGVTQQTISDIQRRRSWAWL